MYLRVHVKKKDTYLWNHFHYYAVINEAPEDTTQLRKIHKQSHTAFWKHEPTTLRKKPSYTFSEEAFWFLEEAFQFVA